MRKTLIFIAGAILGTLVIQPLMMAADITIPFTNGQNNYTRTTSIPAVNAARCLQYPLQFPGGPVRNPISPCTTAEVIAAGCVVEPFSAVTKQNLRFRSCTIYTTDLSGETAYNSDALYERRVADVEAEKETDFQLSRLAWFASTQGSRDSCCTGLSSPRPAGCILVR